MMSLDVISMDLYKDMYRLFICKKSPNCRQLLTVIRNSQELQHLFQELVTEISLMNHSLMIENGEVVTVTSHLDP